MLPESLGHRTMTMGVRPVTTPMVPKQIGSTSYISNRITEGLGYRIIWPLRTDAGKIAHTSGYLPIPLTSGHPQANLTQVLWSIRVSLRLCSQHELEKPLNQNMMDYSIHKVCFINLIAPISFYQF